MIKTSDDQQGLAHEGVIYDDLYRDFRPWLLTYARTMRPAQAEDMVQEAFTILMKRSAKPPPVANPRGYLVGVVQNLATKPTATVQLDAVKPDYQLDRYRDPDLAVAFESLSPQQQTCIALRYAQDQTIPQIAELLGLDPSTIKTHIHRALVWLKQQLGDE